ncbi:MAG: hypothetical protein ACLFNQ_13015 [Spirochaetaceae bacterium]
MPKVGRPSAERLLESIDITDAQTEVVDALGNTYEVGFDQVTSIRQDPFVRKRDAGGNTLWWVRHDETPADAKAVAIDLDRNGTPYVVFSIDGGSNDSERFQRNYVEGAPFSGAPFPSYGPGGGGTVTVVTRLDPESGRITAGTFIIAQLNSGNTNTFSPLGIRVVEDAVIVAANSAAWPPAAGSRASSFERFDPELFNNETRANGNDRFQVALPLDLSELSAVRWIDER